VKALFRRTHGLSFQTEHLVNINNELKINFTIHEVSRLGKRVELTPTEFRLLAELVRNEGRVCTHNTLLEKVWGSEYPGDYSFIKKYMYRLRFKLEHDANDPKLILNERGVGYRLVKSL
jgi:two-component system KDP operon response regulator KdpE